MCLCPPSSPGHLPRGRPQGESLTPATQFQGPGQDSAGGRHRRAWGGGRTALWLLLGRGRARGAVRGRLQVCQGPAGLPGAPLWAQVGLLCMNAPRTAFLLRPLELAVGSELEQKEAASLTPSAPVGHGWATRPASLSRAVLSKRCLIH